MDQIDKDRLKLRISKIKESRDNCLKELHEAMNKFPDIFGPTQLNGDKLSFSILGKELLLFPELPLAKVMKKKGDFVLILPKYIEGKKELELLRFEFDERGAYRFSEESSGVSIDFFLTELQDALIENMIDRNINIG